MQPNFRSDKYKWFKRKTCSKFATRMAFLPKIENEEGKKGGAVEVPNISDSIGWPLESIFLIY